jgi:hypothetical protein
MFNAACAIEVDEPGGKGCDVAACGLEGVDDLTNDRDIVRAAVSQDGFALEYAHADLQSDPELRALAGWPRLA